MVNFFCAHLHVKLAVYVSDLVPEVVIGDPGRFLQIITHLVGNSVKVRFLSTATHFALLSVNLINAE